jgi:hypothetical protein
MTPLIPLAVQLLQFAPHLMRYFGAGEASAEVAEKVVDVAKTVTGAFTPEKAIEMLKADKELQATFQLRTFEIDADLEKAHLTDRQYARKRDVEFIKAGVRNTRGDILAYLAIAGLLGLIIMLFFKSTDMSTSVRDLLLILSGSLVVIVKDVYNFEFGSTRANKDKDATISNLSGAK